jgi:hypothetical protein
MNLDDFPAPKEGFVITHVLVVADPDRSREFYRSLLGGQVLLERDPVNMKVANTWLTLVTGGGPTDDKPGVSLALRPSPGLPAGSSTCAWRTSHGSTRSGRPKAPSFSLNPKITLRRPRPFARPRRSAA